MTAACACARGTAVTQPACTWAGPPCCPIWGDKTTNNAVVQPNSCCLHPSACGRTRSSPNDFFHTTGGGYVPILKKTTQVTKSKAAEAWTVEQESTWAEDASTEHVGTRAADPARPHTLLHRCFCHAHAGCQHDVLFIQRCFSKSLFVYERLGGNNKENNDE